MLERFLDKTEFESYEDFMEIVDGIRKRKS